MLSVNPWESVFWDGPKSPMASPWPPGPASVLVDGEGTGHDWRLKVDVERDEQIATRIMMLMMMMIITIIILIMSVDMYVIFF